MEYIALICFILFLIFLCLSLCATSSAIAKASSITCCLFLIGTIIFGSVADFDRDKRDTYTTVVVSESGNRIKFTDTETNKTYYIDIIKETE